MSTRNVPRALGALALLAAAFAVAAAGAVPAIGAQFQNVFVKNDASSPVPTAAQGVTQVAGTVSVAAPTEQTVQFRRGVGVAADTPGNVVASLYDVPDGKRLIVDKLSANLLADEAGDFFVEVGPVAQQFPLALTEARQGPATTRRFHADTAGPIHVDAVDGDDGELKVRLLHGVGLTNPVTQVFVVSGRLVDRP